MSPVATVRRSEPADAALHVSALAQLLIACVDGGASVSFMHPLGRDRAEAFWRGVIDGAGRGDRVLLVAEDGAGAIVGTVQVLLSMPENQPHRGEIAKLLVHPRARRQGIAAMLMEAADQAARAAGKTLLVLDTVTGGDAERLYPRLGWQRCGVIPDYALWPRGGLCATTVFYKALSGESL
ncbi:MAG TPA: GNAT family N-acetyltransferase [Candidatus Bathyarchaeia archaeon]|nr:GNAT family N-acetyltransferase [Candidatus Bathyarchaeia archaeon]